MFRLAPCALLILGFTVYEANALQCWACSSDLDRSCVDPFVSGYGGLYQAVGYQAPYSQPPYDQRGYDSRNFNENRSDYNRNNPNDRDFLNRDPNYRQTDETSARSYPDYRDRDNRYNNSSRDGYYDRRYNSSDPYYRDYRNRPYNSSDYNYRHGYGENGTNLTRQSFQNLDPSHRGFNNRDGYNNNDDKNRGYYDRDRNYENRDYTNRDRDISRDPKRDPIDSRDPNSRDFDRNIDNRDYRDRDYNNRDPNYRDGNRDSYDRDRNYDNRDYNGRNPNNRDNRDPYFNRDGRDYRDPNNRDYPARDYAHNQGRNYDANYPARDFRGPFAASQVSSGPRMVTCNEDEARLRRMKNVCIKKVQRIGEHQVTYIRRCEMVSYEKDVGTCYDPVARGISLDFCEYCDYDGCNSATSLKLNVILASLVSLVIFLTVWS